MNILLTNDDGIFAPGLQALHRRLASRHAVTVVAPDQERSAVGHGITLHHPLRASRIALNAHFQGYAVNGTPADCVKLGVHELLSVRPDLVVSGINPGANVGINLNYSGTVAGAKEAALCGLPAIAVSVQGRSGVNYEDAAAFAESLAETVAAQGLPRGTFLNVNIPNRPFAEISGTMISRQGTGPFADRFEKRKDPRNRVYFWPGSDAQDFEDDPQIDGAALQDNLISITPIKCDMTDYDLLERLRRWPWDAK
ncbi:MAG: 5'/3'-nucleotidase SurE [Desulfobacterales bacterium]